MSGQLIQNSVQPHKQQRTQINSTWYTSDGRGRLRIITQQNVGTRTQNQRQSPHETTLETIKQRSSNANIHLT